MFNAFNTFDLNKFNLDPFDLSNLIIDELRKNLFSNDINKYIIDLLQLNSFDYDDLNLDEFNLEEFISTKLTGLDESNTSKLDMEIYNIITGLGKEDKKPIQEIQTSEDSQEHVIEIYYEDIEDLYFTILETNELLIIQRHLLPRINQQILLFFANLIKEESKEASNIISTSLENLMARIDLDNNNEIFKLEATLDQLKSTEMAIRTSPDPGYDSEDKYEYHRPITSYRIYPDGSFSVEIDPVLYDALKKIGDTTNILDSDDIFKLHSRFSILLYQILILNPESRRYDFLFISGFIEHYHQEQYESLYQIINFIIEPAISDINKHTGIQVEYRLIPDNKEKDTIIALEFIHKNTPLG